VDFLLVLMEVFLLGVTAEVLRANIDWKSAISLQQGHFEAKFQVEGVAPPTILRHETRVNDLSYGIRMWAKLSFILSQIMHLTEKHMDGQTAFSW